MLLIMLWTGKAYWHVTSHLGQLEVGKSSTSLSGWG